MAQPMWKGQRLLKGMACSLSPRTLSLYYPRSTSSLSPFTILIPLPLCPDSDIDTNLNIYIRLKDSIDLGSRELDTELNAELDAEFNTELDTGLNVELDSKAKEILKDITKLKEEGPIKPNYTSYTKKL
ncbi:hypothetical protein V2W45_1336407 [Cenococcum geophilum]